jgi:thioredoxin 1
VCSHFAYLSTCTNVANRFSDEFPDAHFVKIDVDEVPDVAQELGIRAMPTFVIFKKGEKIGEVVGANPVALRAAIEKATKE